MQWFDAARTGSLDVVEICLFWGQPVDQRTAAGQTALQLAAECGHTAVVKTLLQHNADPNGHAPGVSRPLTAAIENEHWETAAALVRGGADPNADGVASIAIAEPAKRPLLALMLDRGLDPHGANAEWGPYIHFALNDPVCADLFLNAGFDLIRYERETGESLLERALSCGVDRFLHVLSLGANVNLPVDRRNGRTMLMTLAADDAGEQTQRLIQLLVQRGADIDQTDAAGTTALDHARERGQKMTLALLTRLRDNIRRAHEREQKHASRAQTKARALEAAKATRAQKAAAKKAAPARRAAKVKLPKVTSKPLPPPRRRTIKEANPGRGDDDAGQTVTPKSQPDAPPTRPRWSAATNPESL